MLLGMIKKATDAKAAADPAGEFGPELSVEALGRRLEELASSIAPIQGLMEENAGKMLYRLARFDAPVPNIVEIGSWKGRSTAWLASAIRDRGDGKVYAVDTWKGTGNETVHGDLLRGYGEDQLYQEFLSNLRVRELHGNVEAIRAESLKAANNWDPARKIGLLFIDGDHAYEAVRQDFEFWSPHVAVGGYIVFDDVPGWPGPARLVSELPRWYKFLGTSPNNWIVVKEA